MYGGGYRAVHASGQSHGAEEVLERELGRPLVEGGEDGAHGLGFGLVAAVPHGKREQPRPLSKEQ